MKKIVLIFLIFIFLPVLIYTAYEINSLDTTEALIEESYRQQLDAILFSVNQYCWDVANSWANELIFIHLNRQQNQDEKPFNKFLEQNSTISVIITIDEQTTLKNISSLHLDSDQLNQLEKRIDVFFESNPELASRLTRYQQAGYRKIEPVDLRGDSMETPHWFLLIFALEKQPSVQTAQFAGLVIDVKNFIQNIITLKTDEIAQDRFYLSIFYKGEVFPEIAAKSEEAKKVALKKAIWLFPNTYLGIRLQGKTIEELARSRSYNTIILIGVLDILILFAGWFLYRNIRKEMELAQMKSNFVSNVSHELRTPLSLIRMFAETLEMNRVKTNEKKQEYYKIIGQETERLTHLINNILNFSRMESGKKEFRYSAVNLNNIIQKVLQSYTYHLEANGFQLDIHLKQKLPEIKGDEEAISEAFINLIDNAVKYSEHNKFLQIFTRTDNQKVIVDVIDKGIGISQSNQKKIFEKFHRVSKGLVNNRKGSGLGLTLVKNIMEAHNGSVEISSKIGEGSCFSLLFPYSN
jgi:two-component system phosphate regulon sensor histidine kinase PhoR